MRKLLPWEKNWLTKAGWSSIQIAQLEQTDDERPVEYLTGLALFAGLRLRVTTDVLIPRPETEGLFRLTRELVGRFLEMVPPEHSLTFLDVGTGSGCLAVALAREFTSSTVIATDVSSAALAVARDNAERFQVSERIDLRETNLIEGVDVTGDYFLVANLPYIPTADYEKLESSVKDFEPRGALDGGPDGFRLIHELLAQVVDKPEWPLAVLLEVDPTHTSAKLADFPQFAWEQFPDDNGLGRYLVGIRQRVDRH